MAATIKQVAQRAGVSVATVSYVLNGTGTVTDATRQRVLAAVAALEYQPHHAARSMRRRSQTLGLMLSGEPGRLADPALAEVLAGLSEGSAAYGYSLLLAAPDPQRSDVEACLRLVRSGRVDGVVLLEPFADDERSRALADADLPHILAGPPPEGYASPAVLIDGRLGAVMAIEHLLHLGHRQIGLIQLPSDLADSEPRYLGYSQALLAAQVELNPELVIEAGRRENDGYLATQELLSLPEPPTAILACSDELAFGALHALHDAGLTVGVECSLVGFDDVPLAAHTNPPLTTLHQPRHMLGMRLASGLIDMIERGVTAPAPLVLSPRLVVRRSTGKPRTMV